MENKYYEKNRRKILKRLKERYRKDQEFRECAKKKYREQYRKDADYKQKTLERAKSRYHTDEQYRQATIERSIKRNKKMRRQRTNKTRL